MSPLKLLLAAASVAAFSATGAFAQATPDAAPASPAPHAWHKPSPEQMAAWHTRMCTDRYAREAGRLAYLQAALSITDAQRGAFDQWRDKILSSAKAHSQACLARTPGQGPHQHDALEREARMQKHLEAKLAELRAERPALESLYQSLTPEQKQVFDRDSMGHHRRGHHMMGHMGERFGQRHGDGQPG